MINSNLIFLYYCRSNNGYDFELVFMVEVVVGIFVIALSGVGYVIYFFEVFQIVYVDVVFVVGIFYRNIVFIIDVKKYLLSEGIFVRMDIEN